MHCFSSSIRFQTQDQDRSFFVLGDPSDVYKRSDEALLYPRKPDLGDRTKHLVLFYPRRLLARGDVRAKDIRRSTRPIPPDRRGDQTKHSVLWASWLSLSSLFAISTLLSPLSLLSPLALLSSLSPLSSIALLSSLSSNYHMLSSLWIIILIKLLSSLLFLSNYHHNYHSYQVINIIIILIKLSS